MVESAIHWEEAKKELAHIQAEKEAYLQDFLENDVTMLSFDDFNYASEVTGIEIEALMEMFIGR